MYRHFLGSVPGSVFFKENWGNCSRQHVPRGNYKFKLKLPPGLAAVARLLRAACRHVDVSVVFLCFYICGAAVALPVASRVNAAYHWCDPYGCNRSDPIVILWVYIGSGNGLLPVQHQAITWTNIELSVWPLGKKFDSNFHSRKCHSGTGIKWAECWSIRRTG